MNQEVKMKPSYLKIAFLDRDGTIIKDYPDEKWREIKEPEFLKGSIEGLKRLKEMGYDFIIIQINILLMMKLFHWMIINSLQENF